MAYIGKTNYLEIGGSIYEIEDKNAAPLNSPAFTGAPTAPTPTTNSGIATKEYVDNAIGGSGGGTITEVKTNAGAHTTIDVTQGIAEFNVPTTYSHVGAAASSHTHGNITNGGDITATAPTIANGDQIVINDSSASKITNGPTFDGSTTTKALTPKGTWETFSTSDTNTTYTLSNALSSHKFTETLTAGGSGSGTSTATMEFVAGTGISLTDDTTNKKITIASSVTNTDEKVKLTSKSDSVAYKVALAPSSITSGNTYNEYYSTNLTYNPSTKALVTNGTVDGYALAAASAKAVDTSISSASTSGNLPTSAAVASFVEGKGYITGYTETDPVFSASAASGITSSDITNWNSKTSNTGTITGVKTTAGTHTTIDVSSGAANFNVPTKTSHLTNDSGFITSDSDEKLKTTAVASSNTVYYPIFGEASSTASTKYYSSQFRIVDSSTLGTTLQIGQNSSSGRKGALKLVSSNTSYIGTLQTSSTADRTWTLPDATGTIALTSDIPTVPTITLNGSTSTTPSFYAPTSAGTSGYYLKSNGSGAPSWTSFPTIPSITVNGISATSPSFYAPITAGTSGYYLKSNGSGAPTWAAIETGGVSDVTVAGTSVVINNVAAIAAPVQIVRW